MNRTIGNILITLGLIFFVLNVAMGNWFLGVALFVSTGCALYAKLSFKELDKSKKKEELL